VSAPELAELIRAADRVVALTGAGISVPSGIPDFRSPGSGLWANVDPMAVAHIDAFRRDPERFWAFYGERFQTLEDKRPNRAHEVLAELEQAGLLDAVITQNIDQLHARAGSRELVEVHGEPLKPDVVLFGEYLPVQALTRADRLAESADLMLCIGSSLEVYPVAELPLRTLAGGGQIAIITKGSTPLDHRAAVRLDGDVVGELEALAAALELKHSRPPEPGTPPRSATV
jgi:NAD-dependent deacetylase